MVQKSTLRAGVFIVLLFFLSALSQLAHARSVPCDNSQAPSVIPTNEKGKPLMPEEIKDKEEEKLRKSIRLREKDIRDCLRNGKTIINHVIDFDLYVKVWQSLKNSKVSLRIQNSVLWSFKREGLVVLANFGRTDRDGKIKISARIKWSNVTLGPSFSAYHVKFPSRTSIVSSRFPRPTSFRGATFGYRTSFTGATFGDEASFTGATFGDEASFTSATFGDKASFLDATFGYRASFWGATFGSEASFTGVTFGDKASFWDATFGYRASFWGATFGDKAFFTGATFGSEASFTDTTFGYWAFFTGATFGSKASFSDSTFGDRVSFTGATFGSEASFTGVTFDDRIFFWGATFGDKASFVETTFGGDASLREVKVKGKLALSGTHWAGRADFRESTIANLSWDSGSRPSRVTGVFDARGATFEEAIIKDVSFSNLVDFSDTNFGKRGHVTFENVIFEKEVDFLRATFWHDAIFVRNRFRGAWDLTGITFQESIGRTALCLSFNRISKLFVERTLLDSAEGFLSRLLGPPSLERSRIRSLTGSGTRSCATLASQSHEKNGSSQIKNEPLLAIYNTLALSFRESNDRQGENEAWYLGQVADRQQHPPLKRWVCWLFLDIPSRYGIDIYRVVLVSLLLWFLFASVIYIYFRRQASDSDLTVLLSPFPTHHRAFRFRPVEPFFQNQSDQKTRPLSPKDAMFLSGRAFFKLGLGTVYPYNPMLRRVAYVEWAFGMYMLIHFLFVVKNTLPIALPFLTSSG